MLYDAYEWQRSWLASASSMATDSSLSEPSSSNASKCGATMAPP